MASPIDLVVEALETAKAKLVEVVNGPIVHAVEAVFAPDLAAELPKAEKAVLAVVDGIIGDYFGATIESVAAPEISAFLKALTDKLVKQLPPAPPGA